MNVKTQIIDMLWEEIGIPDSLVVARRYTDSYYYVIHKSRDYISIEKFSKVIGNYISRFIIMIENGAYIVVHAPGHIKNLELSNPNVFNLLNKEINKFVI